MHVLVVHNEVGAGASAADRDVLVQVEAVSGALRDSGCTAETLSVSLDLDRLRASLASIGPEVAFNLIESLGGRDRLAPLAPWLFEEFECPYTGAPARTLALLCDKVRAKERLRWAGLLTPEWIVPGGSFPPPPSNAVGAARPADARYIIKPIHDHASFGIGAGSVVRAGGRRDVGAALAQRERRLARPCFAERFIDGREFNVSLLAGPGGPEVLPPAEILFVGFPAAEPRIVGYEAKWDPGSFAFRNTPRRFDFTNSDAALLPTLAAMAQACWHLFGLRGYGRVDFRVDRNGRPWILEVNANPCLAPDAGFAAAVDRAGYSFREAIERMVADALANDRRPVGIGASACEPTLCDTRHAEA